MKWYDEWRELVLRLSFRKGRNPFALRDHVEGLQVHPIHIMDNVPLWEVYVTGE